MLRQDETTNCCIKFTVFENICTDMTARYIFLSILVAVCCKAFAQQPPVNEKQRIRVICHLEYSYADTVVYTDSLEYTYSGSKGSRFNVTDFSSQNDYGYGNYEYGFFHNIMLPAADMPEPFKDMYSMNVQYDSMRHTSIISNPYQLNSVYSHTISLQYADSLLTTVTTRYEPGHSEYISHLAYNAYGKLDNLLTTSNLMVPLDTFFTRRIVYDSGNRPLADSAIDNMYVHHSREYIYAADGRIAALTENYDSRYGTGQSYHQFFGYDMNGRLQTFYQQMYNESTQQWITTDSVYYGRDGEGRLISMTANGRLQYNVHYNPSGDADTLSQYAYDLDMGKINFCNTTVFFYNKYHNPDSAITYVFDTCQAPAARRQRTLYYYEPYVSDTLVISDEVVLFPNPAHNTIYIKWNKIFSTVPVNIDIYSSTGQLASKTQIARPAPTDAINIAGYPPGVYFLRMVNSEKKQLYIGRFVVDR